MIDRLDIENFQSHAHTTLEFHKGVNCIIGSSDVGKSAILRALRWVVFNRPSGDSFRSYGSQTTNASITTNGVTVTRTKGKKNAYIVAGKLLDAVKMDVPEEVNAALNLNNTNIQRQFDRPFLLDDSPGDVARHFNAIANIDDIDFSLKNIQSWIRKNTSDIEHTEEQIIKVKEALHGYDKLDHLDSLVTKLEQYDTETRQHQAAISQLRQIITRIEGASMEIKTLRPYVQAKSIITKVFQNIQEKNETLVVLEHLKRIIERARRVDSMLHDMGALDTINLKFNALSKLDQRYTIVKTTTNQLITLDKQIRSVDKQVSDLQRAIQQDKVTFAENMPDTCPLCGSNLSN